MAGKLCSIFSSTKALFQKIAPPQGFYLRQTKRNVFARKVEISTDNVVDAWTTFTDAARDVSLPVDCKSKRLWRRRYIIMLRLRSFSPRRLLPFIIRIFYYYSYIDRSIEISQEAARQVSYTRPTLNMSPVWAVGGEQKVDNLEGARPSAHCPSLMGDERWAW